MLLTDGLDESNKFHQSAKLIFILYKKEWGPMAAWTCRKRHEAAHPEMSQEMESIHNL